MSALALAVPVFGLFGLLAWSDAEPSFNDRLLAETHVPGGLTAGEAATRADANSGEVAARAADIEVAQATAAQSWLAYLPRLAGSARYTRLSAIEPPVLGVPVAAPTAPLGPLPAGTPLVNVPWRFPVFLDQTTSRQPSPCRCRITPSSDRAHPRGGIVGRRSSPLRAPRPRAGRPSWARR